MAFPRPLAGHRAPRRIPHDKGAVSQRTMRGGPAILKANRQRGISRMGRNDCLLKGGVRIALDRRKETRPSIAQL